MATRSSESDSEGEGSNTLTLVNNNSLNPEAEQGFNSKEHLKPKTSENGLALEPKETKTDRETESAEFLDESGQDDMNFNFPGFSAAIDPDLSSEDEVTDSVNKVSLEKKPEFGPGASLDALMDDYAQSLESDEAKQVRLAALELAKNGGGDYEEEELDFPPPPRTAPAGRAGRAIAVEEVYPTVGKDIEMLVHNVRKAGLIPPDARITPKDFKNMGKSSLKPASPSLLHGLASVRPSTTRPASLNIGSAKQLRSSPSSASGTPKKLTPSTGRSRSRPSLSSLKASPVASDLSPLGPQTKGVVSSPNFGSSLFRPTASASAKYSINNLATTPTGSTAKISKSTSAPSPGKASPKVKMGDAGGGAAGEGVNLKDQFAAFSKFGDSASDGKQITLSNCDKWMKQARVIDGKKITTTDTSIAFKKLFKTAKKVNFDEFKSYVEDLSKGKKLDAEDTLGKLTNCGAPGLSQATKAAHASVVERLTDTSKYTGSHKERFDATGKGRGIEGRREVKDESGYTAAFKGKLGETKKEEIVSPASN